GRFFLDDDGCAWECASEFPEKPWQQERGDRWDGPDANPPGLAVVADFRLRVVGQRDDLLCPGVKRSAGVREGDLPRLPLEHRLAQLFLQARDRPAQGRLRHADRLGRAREVAQLRDLQEMAELLELHTNPWSCKACIGIIWAMHWTYCRV